IDLGILATPLGHDALKETPLYEEPFLAYFSQKTTPPNGEFVRAEDLEKERLWLLEEGHCLRSQIANLCNMKKKQPANANLNYEAGSMESLLRLVDMNGGVTVLPLLSTQDFDSERRKQIKLFLDPIPARQISIVTYRHHIKEQIINALEQMIKDRVFPLLKDTGSVQIIEI
ncbi:LysR substrate-binding domain-containing protein, partial [Balneolaceae bacterium ANBcel3]|nr:LysR substrate-binding domain-containing protein [Balneolaceae bacterium ANBcel3]